MLTKISNNKNTINGFTYDLIVGSIIYKCFVCGVSSVTRA